MSTPEDWPTIDRRAPTAFELWRKHVDERLDEQDRVLREIRDMLGASRMGLAIIKTAVAIGAGLAAIGGVLWTIWHGK